MRKEEPKEEKNEQKSKKYKKKKKFTGGRRKIDREELFFTKEFLGEKFCEKNNEMKKRRPVNKILLKSLGYDALNLNVNREKKKYDISEDQLKNEVFGKDEDRKFSFRRRKNQNLYTEEKIEEEDEFSSSITSIGYRPHLKKRKRR